MDDLVVPDNPSAPGVKAKEIERVVLLQRRLGAAKLNIGPFIGLYSLLFAAWVQQYLENGWVLTDAEPADHQPTPNRSSSTAAVHLRAAASSMHQLHNILL
jgi:hypothetical protein